MIKRIELDWPGQRVEIEWEREDDFEKLVFDLSAKTGPGNVRVRGYFEAGDFAIPADPHKRFVEGIGLVCLNRPELPPLSPDLIVDASRQEDILDRVLALAARQCFNEAEEQVNILDRSHSADDAICLASAAECHAVAPTGGGYNWLREEAIQHWYAWGARATSGVAGAARLLEIYPAMVRFKSLDRGRVSLGLVDPD